jgi:hypothetical protein
MATKKIKRATRRAKTLKAKGMTTKHAKTVKGGMLGQTGLQTTETFMSTLNEANQLSSKLGKKTSDARASLLKNLGS